MTAINEALANIRLGEAQVFQNLQITPLLAFEPLKADYLTLDEAHEKGLATVTEVSESGSVPTLLLENAADVAVFLLDGEELVGAKQNRILNLTVLVPPRSRLHIPVSCVEAGRWNHTTREFCSSDRALYSKGRARKAAHVSEDIAMMGTRRTNQTEVWDDISSKMDSMRVDSRTQAIADVFEQFSGSVDEYVGAFTVQPTQVGACFAINGTIRGVELFDASDTCGKLMPKLVRSYALDAIEERGQAPGSGESRVQAFLQGVRSAPVVSADALGEGEDLRIRSTHIAGGALAARDRVVHLCAFSQESEAGSLGTRGRMRRTSQRRSYRTSSSIDDLFIDGIDAAGDG